MASFVDPANLPANRAPLLCLGTTAYAEVFLDAHEEDARHVFAGLLENLDREKVGTELFGLPVLWSDDVDEMADTHKIICALGTTMRRAWIEDLVARGFELATLVHRSATLSRRADVAPGCVIDPGTVVAAHARIAECVRIGRLVAIGHHLEIGAYSTIHPSVTLSGGCRIGEQVTIGTGAVFTNDVTVGDGAFISAGSVVTSDVPARALVRGNPARAIKQDFGPR